MPVLDVLWSMFIFFLFIAWIWVLVAVVADIFRSHDLSGWAKGLWVLFVIVVPWLGVLAYLIARGDSMTQRHVDDAYAMDQAQRAYIKDASGGTSTADELSKLAGLRDSGEISAEEYASLKAKVMA
jgi:hypothetical protein